MTQVEIVEHVGGSRCMATGSQAARAELAQAERTAFRRFLAQMCPGCEGEAESQARENEARQGWESGDGAHNASPWANASLSQEARGSCFQEVDSEADR